MTSENNKNKTNCGGKKKVMFAYGIFQLGSSVVSAIALAAIALNFSSLQKETELYKNCVEEVQSSGKSSSIAVHYCNGGT
tara:strand:+ start:210 stop:449 length:240 start_codon:yes stop_codon:yes gene_type:complete